MASLCIVSPLQLANSSTASADEVHTCRTFISSCGEAERPCRLLAGARTSVTVQTSPDSRRRTQPTTHSSFPKRHLADNRSRWEAYCRANLSAWFPTADHRD